MPNKNYDVCGHSHSGNFTLEGAQKYYGPNLQLEPVHLDIFFDVDFNNFSLNAKVSTTIQCNNEEERYKK